MFYARRAAYTPDMTQSGNGLEMSRRAVLTAAAALPVAASASVAARLPDISAFEVEGVYLNSGTMHPPARGARAAVTDYFAHRGTAADYPMSAVEERVKERFARLIGASPAELAFVPSTTAGEQMVIDALDLPRAGGRIVTDTLHFFGSFYLYEELARRGMDVAWLRPREGRIPIEDYERTITPGTRLVSLSLVSTYNGFEHDLKRVCEIAHARGALVYADIIHAAGAVPVDLHGSGVDFAATASYKWLMGDFGIGFLYARADRMDRLTRKRFGYYGLSRFTPHVYPLDPPGETIADVAARDDAEGMFAMGTRSHAGIVQLDWSLGYLLDLGVDRLTAWRQPLLDRLRSGLEAKGYSVVTPPGTRAPLMTCVLADAHARLNDRLKRAGVQITLSKNRFRVCPSVFNDAQDIDRLLDALPRE